jgi:hypothetical protein
MSLENPSHTKENNFIEQFPHLSHLTPQQQEKFLVLHVENEARMEKDRLTQEELLRTIKAIAITNPTEKSSISTQSMSFGQEVGKESPKEVSMTTKVITHGVDFIPIVGSAKMIMEGVRGKQYGTDKEIRGTARIIHTASGAVFLALDVTGVGALASEAGKGLLKVGERVALRKIEQVAEREVVLKAGEGVSREVLEKEVGKLVTRGKRRQEKQEEIEKGA